MFVLQLLAYLIGNFVFQPPRSVVYRFLHAPIVFAISWIFALSVDFWLPALLITCVNLLVDLSKNGVEELISQSSKSHAAKAATFRFVFIIDQLLHILFVYFFVYLYIAKTGIIPVLVTQVPANILLIVMAFFICLQPSNVFIQTILSSYLIAPSNESFPNSRNVENAGRLIGSVERCMALVFTMLGQFSAIGFIIAAKTILWYKERDAVRTEYILAGTLLSFGIAIALGIIIKAGFLLPYL